MGRGTPGSRRAAARAVAAGPACAPRPGLRRLVAPRGARGGGGPRLGPPADLDRSRRHAPVAVPRGRARGPGGARGPRPPPSARSEEHTSELQSRRDLVCRLLLEKKKKKKLKHQLLKKKKKKNIKNNI